MSLVLDTTHLNYNFQPRSGLSYTVKKTLDHTKLIKSIIVTGSNPSQKLQEAVNKLRLNAPHLVTKVKKIRKCTATKGYTRRLRDWDENGGSAEKKKHVGTEYCYDCSGKHRTTEQFRMPDPKLMLIGCDTIFKSAPEKSEEDSESKMSI